MTVTYTREKDFAWTSKFPGNITLAKIADAPTLRSLSTCVGWIRRKEGKRVETEEKVGERRHES